MSKSSPTTNSAIEVKDLRVQFEEHVVLEHVTFIVPEKSITAVIGPNGSGKTTLIRAILGLTKYNRGSVSLFGQPLDHVRKAIGYVPQRFEFDRQFPMTVREFMDLARHKHTKPSAITQAMRDVGLASSVLQQQLGTLSGGQLQRTLIAQAILNQPKLLILDEPSSGIDVVGEAAFFHMIDRLRNVHGTTIIIVSHDISFVATSVDHVICINQKLMCSGPPKRTLTKENLEHLFGSTNIYHHHSHKE